MEFNKKKKKTLKHEKKSKKEKVNLQMELNKKSESLGFNEP